MKDAKKKKKPWILYPNEDTQTEIAIRALEELEAESKTGKGK